MKGLVAVASIAFLVLTGCKNQTQPSSVTIPSNTPPKAVAPTSNWYVQEPKVNPIDGTKTQFLSTSSRETEGEAYLGMGTSIPNPAAKIVLCFHDGKLCSGTSIGARIDVHGFVGSEESNVRLRWDDEKPIANRWGVSDSHESVFPSGHQKALLQQMLKHKKLYFEFSYYEQAPQVVTFDLTGLTDEITKAGLELPKEEIVKDKTGRTQEEADSWKTQDLCKARGFSWKEEGPNQKRGCWLRP